MAFNEKLILSQIQEKSRRGVKAAAEWLQKEARQKLTVDRDSTSLPGEYPTTRSGDLRASVEVQDVSTNREVKYKLVLSASHAHHLKRMQRRLLKDFAIDRRKRLISIIGGGMRRKALARKIQGF